MADDPWYKQLGNWAVEQYHKAMDAIGNAGAPNNDGVIGSLTKVKAETNEAYQAATGTDEKVSTGIAETMTPGQHRTAKEAAGNLAFLGALGTIRHAEDAQVQHVGSQQQGETVQQK